MDELLDYLENQVEELEKKKKEMERYYDGKIDAIIEVLKHLENE